MKGEESYLGRVFDSYQNLTQIAACIREASRQLGISAPSVLELSRRETGLQDYIPEIQLHRYPTHNQEVPTLPEPLILPFADGEFEVTLITDVYEHIPREQRPVLLKEMLRITSGLVMVGAPHGNEVVSKSDRVVFDFIWGKYHEKFEPLRQHIEFGLDPMEKIVESLRNQGAERIVALPCNYIYRWIHLILIFFDMQYRMPYSDLFEPFNRIYNERLSPFDYREPCYRYLILVPINAAISIDAIEAALRKNAKESPEQLDETRADLRNAFQIIQSGLADKLRDAKREEERLIHLIEQLQTDNQWAWNEIKMLREALAKTSEKG